MPVFVSFCAEEGRGRVGDRCKGMSRLLQRRAAGRAKGLVVRYEGQGKRFTASCFSFFFNAARGLFLKCPRWVENKHLYRKKQSAGCILCSFSRRLRCPGIFFRAFSLKG
ncbi:unnamed protein product [Scytosiphon promiscuus]